MHAVAPAGMLQARLLADMLAPAASLDELLAGVLKQQLVLLSLQGLLRSPSCCLRAGAASLGCPLSGATCRHQQWMMAVPAFAQPQ